MEPAKQQHPALALFDAGISDLISVVPPGAQLSPDTSLTAAMLGKIPGKLTERGWIGFVGWPDFSTTRADLERWATTGANIGLRARNFPGVDIDVENSAHAEHFVAALEKAFGRPLIRRTGRRGCVLPFRAEVPFGKVVYTLATLDGKPAGLIEILGNGQQYVVSGAHPKAGEYRWSVGGDSGGAELLAMRGAQSLPILSAATIERIVGPTIKRAAATLGLEVKASGRAKASEANGVDHAVLLAPDMPTLREAMGVIPNEGNRHDWITQLYAIKAAAGRANDADGFEIGSEWSQRWDGYNDPEMVQKTWDGLNVATARVGWPFIRDQAREYGFSTAPLDFNVIPGQAAPPISAGTAIPDAVTLTELTDQVALENDVQISRSPALPSSATEPERIAAMHGAPTRALYLALPTFRNDASGFQEAWRMIEKAAHATDPLTEMFRTEVFSAATRLRVSADELPRYSLALDNELNESPRWLALSEPDRQLLRRAAFSQFAKLNALSARAGDSPGPALSHSNVARDDLVRGLIPSKAVAALVAPPGQGKTFVAIDLAVRIAKQPDEDGVTQLPVPERFGGRDVQHGSVFYFTSEDVDGVRQRVARCETAHGELPHLHIFGNVPPLSTLDRAIPFMLEAMSSLAADAPPLKLIVIDVLRAAFEGDENSSEILGTALLTTSMIGRLTGATPLLVHHSGHKETERGRGSSAFQAAIDFCASVSMDGTDITLKVTKTKGAAPGDVLRWRLSPEGVLEAGAAIMRPSELGMAEECATVLATVMCELTSGGRALAEAKIKNAMKHARPDLFGPEVIRTTAITRMDRGIEVACKKGWIVLQGTKWAIGPNILDADPSLRTLADLLSPAARETRE